MVCICGTARLLAEDARAAKIANASIMASVEVCVSSLGREVVFAPIAVADFEEADSINDCLCKVDTAISDGSHDCWWI